MADVLNRTYKQTHQKKYSVLYVDDEEVNLRIFERAFKRYYEVFTAISGADAIKILEANKMDLIMTDQRMPGMTGVELLMKVVPKYPNIVRMIMTGFSDEKAIAKVDETVGLDRYLVKPWNKDDLKEEFDRALKLRKEEAGEMVVEDFQDEPDELDLVKSTLSLVETSENQELKAEINDLVKATKSQKRPEFVQSDTNDLLNLKESLMTIQQEMKLYISDSIIVYDHRTVNKNGYWFGEIEDQLVVVSFHANADAIQALTLNIFLGAMLTELVYKEQILKSEDLIKELSSRISKRFVYKKENSQISLDIAIAVIDKDEEKLVFSSANHDLYFYNSNDELNVLKGSDTGLNLKGSPDLVTNLLDLGDANEIYLIPKNIIEEAIDGGDSMASLKALLEEIHKYPMSMQSKLFTEYNYKSIIGLRV